MPTRLFCVYNGKVKVAEKLDFEKVYNEDRNDSFKEGFLCLCNSKKEALMLAALLDDKKIEASFDWVPYWQFISTCKLSICDFDNLIEKELISYEESNGGRVGFVYIKRQNLNFTKDRR